MPLTRKIAALVLVVPMTIACTSSPDPRPSFRTAPPASAAQTNPYAGSPEAELAGRKLFLQDCAQCHGDDARGGIAAPSLRTRDVEATPPGALTWFLANGDLRHGMPSWSRMPEERRWQIVTYLKSLRQ